MRSVTLPGPWRPSPTAPRAPAGTLVWALAGLLALAPATVARTQGQMEDNIRAVRALTRMTPDELAAVRRRAVSGAGVHTGPTLEYWKKPATV